MVRHGVGLAVLPYKSRRCNRSRPPLALREILICGPAVSNVYTILGQYKYTKYLYEYRTVYIYAGICIIICMICDDFITNFWRWYYYSCRAMTNCNDDEHSVYNI